MDNSLNENDTTPKQNSIPRPIFVNEPQFFSTKKERRTPRVCPPPRPPAKTCAPISRIFRRRPEISRAQTVTFLDSPDGSLTGTPLPQSSVYDGAKNRSYFEQAFVVIDKIGEGCFGAVFKVRSKEDSQLYAIKIAHEKYRGPSDRKRKLEEVRKHQVLLPNANCVHFYLSWEQDCRLYQQFELCERSLYDLVEVRHEIPESLVWKYLVDLLLAVGHLHDHDLIHMDIKPENIFIGINGVCKLGDFGLVIDLKKCEVEFAVEGDPKYLAAEILQRNYSKSADIFALGVTMLELSTDIDLPRQGELWHQLRHIGPDPNLTSHLSPNLRRIIQLMMGYDPERRPTVQQLLALPSVVSARRWRRNELLIRSTLSSIYATLCPAFLLLVYYIFVVIDLVKQAALSFKKMFFGYGRVLWQLSLDSSSSFLTQNMTAVTSTPTNVTETIPGANSILYDDDDSNCSHSLAGSPLAVPIFSLDDIGELNSSEFAKNKSRISGGSISACSTPTHETKPYSLRSQRKSSQKRLNFDSWSKRRSQKLFNTTDSSLCEEDDTACLSMFDIKPVVLADKFDLFSDDE